MIDVYKRQVLCHKAAIGRTYTAYFLVIDKSMFFTKQLCTFYNIPVSYTHLARYKGKKEQIAIKVAPSNAHCGWMAPSIND